MSEPRTETQDGPTTRKPQGTPFSEWTILTADDVDGVTWYFHVPTAAVEREAATPPLDVRWLADELGMHQFVNDRQCDCGDWDAFRDRGTFNDHVAKEVAARLAQQDGTEE